MASDNQVYLTPSEQRHQEVMRSVVDQVQDTPYVLKGGTALLLTRDLPRHSTDLDFDSSQKLNLDRRIREGLRNADVEVISFNKVKDTDTVQRFKIHYADEATGEDTLLKIETSFRDAPDPSTIEVVDGIRTYNISAIYDQKLDAIEARTAPRDLYDLAHLTKAYASELTDSQILRADDLTADMDKLANRFELPFEEDAVVSRITSAEDVVVEFRDAIETELDSHSRDILPARLVSQIADLEELAGEVINPTMRLEMQSEISDLKDQLSELGYGFDGHEISDKEIKPPTHSHDDDDYSL